jgi:uncharacterized phage protein (TIGR01671 family)
MREIKFRAWDGNAMWNVREIDFDTMQVHIGIHDEYINNIKLMQYTGLKDKNGVGVFESDIVRIHHEDSPDFNAEVFYHERWGAFEVAATGNTIGWYTDIKDCVEVIGNIHENPELLE